MKKTFRIVLAQLNFLVGDIDGNVKKHLQAAKKARDEHQADMIIFPELGLTGFPPEDLLLRPDFIQTVRTALKHLIHEIKDIYCLVGHPHKNEKGLFNTCTLFYNGHILQQHAKQYLPNYGVFDEARYFDAGVDTQVTTINHIPMTILICEDIWRLNPIREASANGARLILIPNASPFEMDKHEQRVSVLTKRATHANATMIYVNMVGAQDELVFDGGSLVVNPSGQITHCAGFFEEALLPVDIDLHTIEPLHPLMTAIPSKEERIYQALVLGLRDYVEKNHFSGVLLGLSGGIDSALTLTIAVDALGKDRVHAVILPSRYSAEISVEDAKTMIKTLQVSMEEISIEPAYQAFLDSLTPSFIGKKDDVTEENIQARVRAVLLMALSNKSGKLLLTTGNRSELAVGYCTLYGDMAGGFAVIKDVPKTMVYQLAHYRNQIESVIPQRVIERAPTAELAPNQKDEDSLPPYDVLDRILDAYLNHSQSIDEIATQGINREIIVRVVELIHKNEYKRRQATIGTHINHKSFIKDWRYPLTNGFKG